MASLGSLPAEVFGLIARLIDDGHYEGTLAALAATCRGFYRLTMPHLYHEVVKRHPALLFWAALFGRVATAKRLIDAGARVSTAMAWQPWSQHDVDFENFESACDDLTPRKAYRWFRRCVATSQMIITKKIKHPYHYAFWFPIHLAAMSGSVEMVELLVSTSPSIMARRCYRLCKCLGEDSPRLSPEEQEPSLCLPLHVATCHGHLDVVRLLFEHGCGLTTTFKLREFEDLQWDVSTPPVHDALHEALHEALHDAARFGQVDVIKFILDGGYETNVHVLDGRQYPPIWHAYLHGQWEAIDVLLARGADIDDDVGYGYTPLIDACIRKNPVAVAELIDRSANANVVFYSAPPRMRHEHMREGILHFRRFEGYGLRPIDICCWVLPRYEHLGDELLELSLHNATQTWQPMPSEILDEHHKERDQRIGMVSKLLAGGADFNQGPTDHPAPLIIASACHLSRIVGELIERGASVNTADKLGASPLAAVFAYRNCYFCPFHPEVSDEARKPRPFLVGSRIRRDANYGDLNPDQGGCLELRTCVDLLLQSGADAARADVHGNTPLCRLFAARRFRCYLDIDINFEISLCISPADRSRIAPLLLQHGANPEDRMVSVDPWRAPSDHIPVAEWAVRRWPRTLLEHAFWDADVGACQRLLEAGVVPGQDTALWMIRHMLEESYSVMECTSRMQAMVAFVRALSVEPGCAARGHPLSLTLALRLGALEMAQETWDLGPELSQFSETVEARCWTSPGPAPIWEQVDIGVLCLHGATEWQLDTVLEGLLELGVKPVPRSAMLVAVGKKDDSILEILVKHGGMPHVRDCGRVDGDSRQEKSWERADDCINPMKYAIKRANHSAIRIMLKGSQGPIDPWFRYFYLREAFTFLRPATVACLLEHPSMHFDEGDITDEADLPLAYLVRHAGKICARIYFDQSENVGAGSRLENIKSWMGCVAAFAQAGVDPAMRDRAGRSALDYLGEHIAYLGRDRFRSRLASVLRSAGGLNTGDPLLDPAACYEALKGADIEAEE